MRKIISILYFLLICTFSFSQNSDVAIQETPIEIQNTIHINASTIAFVGFWTFNYEKTLKQKPGEIIRFRTGYIYSYDSHSYGIPLGLTFLFGKSNKHYFDLSIGAVPRILEEPEKGSFGIGGYLYYKYSIYPLIDLGYRFEPGIEKLFYRVKVGWTGLGIGVGYAF